MWDLTCIFQNDWAQQAVNILHNLHLAIFAMNQPPSKHQQRSHARRSQQFDQPAISRISIARPAEQPKSWQFAWLRSEDRSAADQLRQRLFPPDAETYYGFRALADQLN